MSENTLYDFVLTMQLQMQFCNWFLRRPYTGERLAVRRTLLAEGYGVEGVPFFLTSMAAPALHAHLFGDDRPLDVWRFFPLFSSIPPQSEV